MSHPNRIPRPRHLFPEVAFGWIQCQRGLLRLRWALKEDHDWIPAWSIGSIAGVCGVMLAVCLFFLGEPRLAASPTMPRLIEQIEPLEDVPAPVWPLRPLDPAPEPTPAAPVPALTFPDLSLKRPDLTGSYLTRTQLPYHWDQTERLEIVSRPQRLPEPFLKDDWTRSDRLRNQLDSFRPYLLQGATIPVPPSSVSSLALRTPFDGIETRREQGIRLQKQSPLQAQVGQSTTYEIRLSNLTDDPIDDLVVREKLPVIQRVAQVQPPAAVQGDELVWSVGRLLPRSEKIYQVTLLPEAPGELETVTTVESRSRIGGLASITNPTPIREPEPELLPEPPVTPLIEQQEFIPVEPAPLIEVQTPEPEKLPLLELAFSEVQVTRQGEIVSITFEVSNVGTAVAEDVVLFVDLSKELRHKHGERVKHVIRQIPPGQTHQALFRATARTTGTGQLAASLTRSGSEEKARVVSIPISAPAVELSTSKPAPTPRPTPRPSHTCERPTPERYSDFWITHTDWYEF